MTPFEELSVEDLIALTSDQIDRYVDLACAEAGIPLLPVYPGPQPTAEVPCDATIYTLPSLDFQDQAEALQIADVVRRCVSLINTEYVPGPGYKRRIADRQASTEIAITATAVYQRETALTMKTKIETLERAKADHVEAFNEYERVRYKRQEVQERFTAEISLASSRKRREAIIRTQYARYLDLADGRRVVAAKFLKAAHTDADTICPDLFEPETNPAIGAPRAYIGDPS